MADPRNYPQQPRRRTLPEWTSNPLAVALIAAVVAGVVSFLVASYQSHTSAKQALGGQQAAAAIQLQTDATAYYKDITVYEYTYLCKSDKNCSSQGVISEGNPYEATSTVDKYDLNGAIDNMSDKSVITLADNFLKAANNLLSSDLSQLLPRVKLNDKFSDAYRELMIRCGQIIQGRQ